MRPAGITLAGLAVITLALGAGCGGGGYGGSTTPTTPTPPPASGGGSGSGSGGTTVTITIVGMNGAQSYSPNPATVKVGDSVVWRNEDSLQHTATANARGFDTGLIDARASSNPITVNTAGTFGYLCLPHPDMVGTLVVTP